MKLFQQQVSNFFRHALDQRKAPAFNVVDDRLADISIAETIADIIAGRRFAVSEMKRTAT